MKTVVLTAPVREQPIARFSSMSLQAGNRLVADPAEDVMLDPVLGEPISGLSRFLKGTLPEPVIDGQADHPASLFTRPAIGEQGKRQAVGTAGDCDRQKRLDFEGSKGRHASGEDGRIEGLARLSIRIAVVAGPEVSLRVNDVIAV